MNDTSPRVAEDALVARYREAGFLVIERLVSREAVTRLCQRTRDIAEGLVPEFPLADIELEPGAATVGLTTVRKLNRCAENDAIFLDHARDSRVLDVVESLLGPDIKVWGSQCFMKPPGGVEKPFHQDSAYFPVEPFDLVTCWTALDDVTLDNGCMWVIPGSHGAGIIDHSQEWLVGDRADMQVPDEKLDASLQIPIVMPAGSCSFHHSLLLHRSAANHTALPRRGLAVHYMSARSQWTDPSRPKPNFQLVRGRAFAGCV